MADQPEDGPEHVDHSAGARDKLTRNVGRIVAQITAAKRHHAQLTDAGRAKIDAIGRDIAELQRQLHAEDGDVHPADTDLLERLMYQRRQLETLFSGGRPAPQ